MVAAAARSGRGRARGPTSAIPTVDRVDAVRYRPLIPLLLLGLGVAAIAESIASGGATFWLIVVVPVVTGSSPFLLLGALLLISGVLLLPWGFSTWPPVDSAANDRPGIQRDNPNAGETSGGVVLIGPLPLFFGSWKNPSRGRYWLAVVFGAVLVLIVVVVVLGRSF